MQNKQNLTEFLSQNFKNEVVMIRNYKGIIKADFPKWNGWEIIKSRRKQGLCIETRDLDILAQNFFIVQFLIKTNLVKLLA